MDSELEKVLKKIVSLEHDVKRFRIDFMNRDNFKDFAYKLNKKLVHWNEICVTSYFSEGIRGEFEEIANAKLQDGLEIEAVTVKKLLDKNSKLAG